jgi:hypothetical protein
MCCAGVGVCTRSSVGRNLEAKVPDLWDCGHNAEPSLGWRGWPIRASPRETPRLPRAATRRQGE